MKVEFRFPLHEGDKEEQVRTYDGKTCQEALDEFYKEFPDEATRPNINHIIFDNPH